MNIYLAFGARSDLTHYFIVPITLPFEMTLSPIAITPTFVLWLQQVFNSKAQVSYQEKKES